MVSNYNDFCKALSECGFSMGGGSAKGIYAIIPYDWKQQESVDSPVKWHTQNPETDPWEWRMRVLEERDDVAYAKFFFRSSGYITKEWYPYFYAVRRKGEDFGEAYRKGTVSQTAKRIYDIVSGGAAALHEIKQSGGFSREENAKFDRALVELQMRMYITMCGRLQKIGQNGQKYGWNSTVLTTVEDFWESRGVSLPDCGSEDAFDKIRNRILELNPEAEEKNIKKFILG